MDLGRKVSLDNLLKVAVICLQLFDAVTCYGGDFRFDPESIWRGTIRHSHFKGDPTVCADSNWNFNSAQIVCKSLGFTGAMFYRTLNNPSNPEDEPSVDCQFTSASNIPIPCHLNYDCQQIAWAACQVPGYKGCYFGEGFPAYTRFPVSGGMTIEECLEGCRNHNGVRYRYAALSQGTDCYCSDELPRSSLSRAASNCDQPCSGDAMQACGGASNTHSALYDTILGSCDGYAMTSNSGYVTSPGFPGEVLSGQSCDWHFETDYYNGTKISVIGAEVGAGGGLGVTFEVETIHRFTLETDDASFTIERDAESAGDRIWRTDKPIEKAAADNILYKNMTIGFSSSASSVKWFVIKFEISKVDFEMPTTTPLPTTTPSRASSRIIDTHFLVIMVFALFLLYVT